MRRQGSAFWPQCFGRRPPTCKGELALRSAACVAGNSVASFAYHVWADQVSSALFEHVASVNSAHSPTAPRRAMMVVSLDVARQALERAHIPAGWCVTPEQFQAALERSIQRRFGSEPAEPKKLLGYVETLHLADLVLACACSVGNEQAWNHFVAEYRPELYRAARAIAGESGRELADSLYAELYGLRESGGARNSLFDYFHGRSKLTTWLRAILAQRHVDAIRRASRTESLDDPDGEGPPGASTLAGKNGISSNDPERQRFLAILQATLEALLAALAPRDRLRLAHYYVDALTLAQIGKLMGEHEATVSRKLERTRRDLRRQIDLALRKKNLSDAQRQLCYDYAREQWPFDLTLPLRAVPPSAAPGPSTADTGQTG